MEIIPISYYIKMGEVEIILRLQLKMHKLVVHANIQSAQT